MGLVKLITTIAEHPFASLFLAFVVLLLVDRVACAWWKSDK